MGLKVHLSRSRCRSLFTFIFSLSCLIDELSHTIHPRNTSRQAVHLPHCATKSNATAYNTAGRSDYTRCDAISRRRTVETFVPGSTPFEIHSLAFLLSFPTLSMQSDTLHVDNANQVYASYISFPLTLTHVSGANLQISVPILVHNEQTISRPYANLIIGFYLSLCRMRSGVIKKKRETELSYQVCMIDL